MTDTTNIYQIRLRMLGNTPFAVCVSADNKRQEKPPVLMRGVPAVLQLALFDANGRITGATLNSLYDSFRMVIANDFDDDTAPILISDDGECEVDAQNNLLVVPISSMNTEELATLIGVRERIDLGAELQMFNSSVQDEPIVAYQFPINVQNRRDLTGTITPSPVSRNYYTKEQTDGRIATAIAEAKADATTAFTALSGASGTVSPGGIYTLAMTEDFTLSASAETQYGEAVVFVTPGDYVFSVAEGIALDADMSSGNNYRLLISWTPFGVHVEQTAEWEAA